MPAIRQSAIHFSIPALQTASNAYTSGEPESLHRLFNHGILVDMLCLRKTRCNDFSDSCRGRRYILVSFSLLSLILLFIALVCFDS